MALLRPTCQPRGGFTLVEVCIALGIMSFALVAMVGVLPSGLSHLNNTIDQNRTASIFQNVLTEARQTDFQELSQKGAYERYFTNEGTDVPAGDRRITYTAKISIKKGTLLPGEERPQDTLLTVTVEIRKTPGGASTAGNSLVGKTVSLLACNDLSPLNP